MSNLTEKIILSWGYLQFLFYAGTVACLLIFPILIFKWYTHRNDPRRNDKMRLYLILTLLSIAFLFVCIYISDVYFRTLEIYDLRVSEALKISNPAEYFDLVDFRKDGFYNWNNRARQGNYQAQEKIYKKLNEFDKLDPDKFKQFINSNAWAKTIFDIGNQYNGKFNPYNRS